MFENQHLFLIYFITSCTKTNRTVIKADTISFVISLLNRPKVDSCQVTAFVILLSFLRLEVIMNLTAQQNLFLF